MIFTEKETKLIVNLIKKHIENLEYQGCSNNEDLKLLINKVESNNGN